MPQRHLPEESAEESHVPEKLTRVSTQIDPVETRLQEINPTEDIESWLEYIADMPAPRWDFISFLIAAGVLIPTLWSNLTTLYDYLFVFPEDAINNGYASSLHVPWFQMLIFMITPVMSILIVSRIHRARGEAQEDLQLGTLDVRWVGPLIDALSWPNARIRALAARTLTRLLPRLRPEHAGLIDAGQRKRLYAKLHSPSASAAFKYAILKSLDRIGDAQALDHMERVINRTAWLPNQRRLRRLAIDRLPVLESRLGQEPAKATPPASTEIQEPYRASNETLQEPQEEKVTESQETSEPSTEEKQQLVLLDELRNKQQQPALRVAFLVASWFTIVPYTAWNAVRGFLQGAWLPTAVWIVLFVTALQLNRLVLSGRHRELARKLAVYKRLQFVGTFVEMLDWPDREIQRIARETLTDLLPQMRASDTRLLNAAHWRCLYRQLNVEMAKRHGPFLKAILKALEQVGDETAVPYVERLASSPGITRARREVRDAARECLPALYSRSEQVHASQTLLRASVQEEDRAAMLLRPTSEAVTTDPEQLLRATASEEGNR